MNDGSDQRRLSAILAADVVGYTLLMEQDTEGTVAAWKTVRSKIIDPTISEYSGRIVKHTGDGFLAEFKTVQDAVKCAITMQKGLAESPLDFRMGVNLGDIVDDGEDIHGEGVNIAARIEGLAEPGGICISGGVYEQVRNQIAASFEDQGEQEVKHVSAPVRVFRVVSDGDGSVSVAKRRGSATKRWAMATGGLVLLAIAGVAAWQQLGRRDVEPVSAERMALTDMPSIAVLPFTNMSDDKEQEYFSDGMTEDLITDLSKISGLTVVSRTSTSGYKDRKIDVREVGKALGVRFVVEGSVRKAGEQVRINAQLIDATTGGHLWADRYDGNLKDIFALQDKVLEKIVGSLALTLSEKERLRLASRGTDSIVAHDLYLQGLFEESKFNRESNAEAVRLYEQALSIDPDYPLPYARQSNILQYDTRSGWSDDVQADLEKAVQLAEKAVALDDQDPNLHWILSRAVARIHKPGALKQGIKAMKRAIELDPDFADAYAFLGILHAGDGRPEDGLRSVETAMRLNPRFPFWYLFMRGMARFMVEDYEKAIADLERAVNRSPTAHFLRFLLAATYAQAGRQDDAEWQIEELMAMGFTGNMRTITETQPIQHPPYLKRYRAALRKAGIPE